MSGVYWGAGRECRYSGARSGICSIRGIGDLLGGVGTIRGQQGHHRGRGVRGILGAGRV